MFSGSAHTLNCFFSPSGAGAAAVLRGPAWIPAAPAVPEELDQAQTRQNTMTASARRLRGGVRRGVVGSMVFDPERTTAVQAVVRSHESTAARTPSRRR